MISVWGVDHGIVSKAETYYHGTSRKHAKKMVKHGYKPREQSTYAPDNQGKIWATKDRQYASYYANVKQPSPRRAKKIERYQDKGQMLRQKRRLRPRVVEMQVEGPTTRSVHSTGNADPERWSEYTFEPKQVTSYKMGRSRGGDRLRQKRTLRTAKAQRKWGEKLDRESDKPIIKRY